MMMLMWCDDDVDDDIAVDGSDMVLMMMMLMVMMMMMMRCDMVLRRKQLVARPAPSNRCTGYTLIITSLTIVFDDNDWVMIMMIMMIGISL